MGQVRGTNGGASSFPFVIYNDNYDFDEYITAVGEQRLRGRAVVAGGPRRRRRGHAAPHAGRRASRRWRSTTAGRARRSSGRTPTWRTHIRDAIRCACGCCRTSTTRSRSTTSRARRSCDRCSSSKASRWKPRRNATRSPSPFAEWYEIKDQYMFGDALLVAPIAPGAKNAQRRAARRQVVRLLHRQSRRRERDDRM